MNMILYSNDALVYRYDTFYLGWWNLLGTYTRTFCAQVWLFLLHMNINLIWTFFLTIDHKYNVGSEFYCYLEVMCESKIYRQMILEEDCYGTFDLDCWNLSPFMFKCGSFMMPHY